MTGLCRVLINDMTKVTAMLCLIITAFSVSARDLHEGLLALGPRILSALLTDMHAYSYKTWRTLKPRGARHNLRAQSYFQFGSAALAVACTWF